MKPRSTRWWRQSSAAWTSASWCRASTTTTGSRASNSVRLYGPLLEAGIEILEFNRTMLHQKTMVVDARWATVGTTNFDNRSFAHNEENNVCVYDAAWARRLHDIFLDDVADAIASRSRHGGTAASFRRRRRSSPRSCRTRSEERAPGSRATPASTCPSSGQARPCAWSPGDNEQQRDRAQQRHDEARRLAFRVEPHGLTDVAGDDGADDPQQHRDDDAARVPAGHDQLGQRADDEPEDRPTEQSHHGVLPRRPPPTGAGRTALTLRRTGAKGKSRVPRPARPPTCRDGTHEPPVRAHHRDPARRRRRRRGPAAAGPGPGNAEDSKRVGRRGARATPPMWPRWSAPTSRAGNQYDVLTNGDQFLPAMLEAIAAARTRIVLETYIYDSGDVAAQFTTALEQAARRGVMCAIVVDAVGSAGMESGHVQRLESAGCVVATFNPPHWYKLEELNYRSHRKILVVDGEVGFTGGAGIADQFAGDAQDRDHWRDTQVRMRGPIVRLLEAAFYENFSEVHGPVIPVVDAPSAPTDDRRAIAVLIRSSPTGGSNDLKRLYLLALASARRSVDIDQPVFPHGRVDAVGARGRRQARRPHPHPRRRRHHRCQASEVRLARQLRPAAATRHRDPRVSADDAAHQGAGRGRRLQHRRLGQLRQPLVRAQRRAQHRGVEPRTSRAVCSRTSRRT